MASARRVGRHLQPDARKLQKGGLEKAWQKMPQWRREGAEKEGKREEETERRGKEMRQREGSACLSLPEDGFPAGTQCRMEPFLGRCYRCRLAALPPPLPARARPLPAPAPPGRERQG